MEPISNIIHSVLSMKKVYKFSFIMMKLKCVTLWDLSVLFTSYVNLKLNDSCARVFTHIKLYCHRNVLFYTGKCEYYLSVSWQL